MTDTEVVPAKNVVKSYVENGYYHMYNRGVEKRKIFLDEQDCIVFLHYLKLYLSRYIHLNSRNLNSNVNFIDFSSYPYYLGRKQASWVKPQEILHYFKTTQKNNLKNISSYQSFVEDYLIDSQEVLGDVVLEDEF